MFPAFMIHATAGGKTDLTLAGHGEEGWIHWLAFIAMIAAVVLVVLTFSC